MSRTPPALAVLTIILAGAMLWAQNRPEPHAAPASGPAGSQAARGGLPPDQEQEVLAFVQKYLPDLHEQLQGLDKENPARRRFLLAGAYRFYRRVQRYPEGPVRDAAIARNRINGTIYQVVKDLHAATDAAEKTRLTERLKTLLAEQFEHDQVVKEYEVQSLKKQLAELSEEVENRRKRRQEIIQEKLQRLLTPTTLPAGRDANDR